ncbi:MAG: tRNA lysidine(34) synthetase TilS [Candidatus Caldatribacteriota bacterium]
MIEEKIINTIQKYNMLTYKDRIVIGVSGGPDSLTLLNVLLSWQKKYNLSLYIAHFNHKLRGQESDQEADFVQKLAEKLNLPFIMGESNLNKLVKEKKISLEEAAREARYSFYFKVVEKFKAQKIALGHNADDQVETILMRFLRGSGLEGLNAIPPVRGKIIRPLIECSREEIEKYCLENNIDYRIDSSNKKPIYFRNKIRLELLPLLITQYNQNLKNNLLNFQVIISEILQYLQQKTEEIFMEMVEVKEGKEAVIGLKRMNSLPPVFKRRIIRKMIEQVKGDLNSIDFVHIDNILQLTDNFSGEKEICLPDNLRAKRVYQYLTIFKNSIEKYGSPNDLPSLWEYQLSTPGYTEIKPLKMEIEVRDLEVKKIEDILPKQHQKFPVEFIEVIDQEKVKLPLKLRNRREGDFFYPLKLGGKKKIKELFIDDKIPRSRRRLIPLLIDGEGKIVWVVGIRLDERAKITADTKKVWKISIKTKIDLFNMGVN